MEERALNKTGQRMLASLLAPSLQPQDACLHYARIGSFSPWAGTDVHRTGKAHKKPEDETSPEYLEHNQQSIMNGNVSVFYHSPCFEDARRQLLPCD